MSDFFSWQNLGEYESDLDLSAIGLLYASHHLNQTNIIICQFI